MGLQDNLDALPLATRHAVESSRAEGVIQIHSSAALMSASVRTPDGRWIRIHSGRDPVSEADRFLGAAVPGVLPPRVFVVGPGLGYLLEAIERRSADTRVIALEPFPAVARAMLERRDWRDWITSGRLTLLVGPDYAGASDAWKLLDARAASPAILDHIVLAREFPADVARAHRLADTIVLGAKANDDARKRFAGRYLLNTLANLPALVAEGDVASLRDLCPGMPAVVIAAGPSLDDNIERLRTIDGRALIIAVDTTLRPLRAAGIEPHLVVAVDPSELNAKHLVGAAGTGGSWLVSEGSIDPRVFPEFAGRAFTFKVSDHHPWPWLRAHGIDRGVLRAWGSVLTTAFDLGCHVGCDPIVFAGVDLAYTNGVHYCAGTIHEDTANHRAPAAARADAFAAWMREHKRPTCMETDIRGASVVSTPDFVQFRDWVVARSVAVQPRRVLNATGAGILHGGAITQVDLATLSFPPLAGGADAIRTRLGAAWRSSVESRDRLIEKLEGSMSRPDGDGIPLGPWLAFAGDTASSAQITGGVETARRSIALAWKSPPRIAGHPASVFWMPGWTASFTAAATGGPAPTVQWQMSGDDGASWVDMAGATDTTYKCVMTAATIGKQFRAVFRNASGSATTTPAVVSSTASGVVHDFNGDGKPDILWRSSLTGVNVVSYLDGVTQSGLGVPVAVPDLGWTLVGAGDFNGDGKPDILWHHSMTGDTVIWYMDGLTRSGHRVLDVEADLAWTIVGTGDFNGNGTPDILWRHSVTGANRVWHMNGGTPTSVATMEPEADLDWAIAGTADFNGDGQPDILWRNAITGANRVWYMDGITRTGVGILDAEPDLTWTIVGTGDFNGDGKPDILWRNAATGAAVVWYLDGVARTGLGALDSVTAPPCTISQEEAERRAGAISTRT